MKLKIANAAFLLGIAACSTAPRQVVAQERGAAALGELVDGLGVAPRVLMIAAHPDDEDTRLIAWLARGQHVETAYLSLTRGDGGQNLIGNELGEALGVIRTQELLAARRIDGAHQYFGREFDFGFSKTAAETYTHWPHDSVLADIVTVIRAFRPHIIVAVFSGTAQDGHGHHQVSGLLSREAFDVSGDTTKFPTAKYGPAWTVSKFYRDRSYFGGGASLTIPVGEYNPLLGESYAEIASRSRSQHLSQGFGQLIRRGPFSAEVYREASRVNSGSEQSMFEGLDNTSTLAPYRFLIDSIRRRWNPDDPTPIVPSLVRLVTMLQHATPKGLDAERTIAIARGRAEQALVLASGVAIEATVPHDVVAVGDTSRVSVAVYDRGGSPIKVDNQTVAADAVARDSFVVKRDSITQPWWLEKLLVGDLFGTPVSRVAEDQRDANTVKTRLVFGADDDPVEVTAVTPIVERLAIPSKGEVDRPLAIVPGVSVTFDQTVEYVPTRTNIDRLFGITLRSGWSQPQDVKLSVQVPKGLRADSISRDVTLPAYGERRVEFRVTGSLASAGTTTLGATATAGGKEFKTGYVPIEYDHIQPQKLYRDAVVQLVGVDVKTLAGVNVGYIRGVGDNVAPTLAALGVSITMLDPSNLGNVDLAKFGAIVVGTRAYMANPDLRSSNGKLFGFVRQGGTLLVQYGQYEMTTDGIMPYAITLSRPADRVTDENAPVRILDAASPLLNTPNKIGPSDWQGWVQERSTYMPHTFDSHYHAIVSMNDPGENPDDAGILETPLGNGVYIYTTLSFFRQLPAGNPGAARLFVNLLAAGHTQVVQ